MTEQETKARCSRCGEITEQPWVECSDCARPDLSGRVAELEAQLDEAKDAPNAPDCDHPFRVTGDTCGNCGEQDGDTVAMARRIRELEAQLAEANARLDAIDNALDDADAPDATEAHALDNDPIIERIKLWTHAHDEIGAQLDEANARVGAWIEAALRRYPPNWAFDATNPMHVIDNIMRGVGALHINAREKELEAQVGQLRDFAYNRAPKLAADEINRQLGEANERIANVEAAAMDIVRPLVEAAEARAEAMRAALVKVEAYMASEEGPIENLWKNGDIGDYDDHQTDWQQTLFDVRDWKNGCVPAASLGGGVEWPVIVLYREILQVLEPAPYSRISGRIEG